MHYHVIKHRLGSLLKLLPDLGLELPVQNQTDLSPEHSPGEDRGQVGEKEGFVQLHPNNFVASDNQEEFWKEWHFLCLIVVSALYLPHLCCHFQTLQMMKNLS
jgi:hypothetical protein